MVGMTAEIAYMVAKMASVTSRGRAMFPRARKCPRAFFGE